MLKKKFLMKDVMLHLSQARQRNRTHIQLIRVFLGAERETLSFVFFKQSSQNTDRLLNIFMLQFSYL